MAAAGTKRAKKTIVFSHVHPSEAALAQAYALATIGIKPKHTPEYDHVDYLEHLIVTENLRATVTKCLNVLGRMSLDFDAIAFTGNSGALIAPILALALGKTMLLVRKKPDGNKGFDHSRRKVEGDIGARTYIIVDDQVATGNTLERVKEEIKQVAPEAKCLGILDTYWIDNYINKPKRGLRPATRDACWDDSKCKYV